MSNKKEIWSVLFYVYYAILIPTNPTENEEYTGYTQKNGAVSKVNKKLISQLTRAQRTPSAAETWTFSAADSVRCAREKWEINSLLTFETAPFFYVYPVYSNPQKSWS